MSRYVEESLLPGEQVVFRTPLHWVMFFWPLALALWAMILYSSGASNAATVFLVIAGVWGLLRSLEYSSSEFAVTSRRIVIRVGVVRRRTLELQIAKVEAIGVNQGLGGRMLDYGTIVVTGTGGTKEIFKRIANPMQFRRAVQATQG